MEIPKPFCISIYSLLMAFTVHAQEPTEEATYTGTLLQDQIEALAGHSDAEPDFENAAEELFLYNGRRINLNRASDMELRSLQLNDLQIFNLQEYIRTYGELVSPNELNLVEGFDTVLVSMLTPYITLGMQAVQARITPSNLIKHGRHQILMRYQQRLEKLPEFAVLTDSAGNTIAGAKYLGGPEKVLVKYGYSFSGRTRFGLTMEKDPGETLFPKNDTLQKGFDFYGLHFFLSGTKILKLLAVGDYHLSFGQGLVMHSSMVLGKSSAGISTRRITRQIRPAAGSNESRFMRGAAITLSPVRNTDVTIFYSNRRIDARLAPPDSTGMRIIESLQTSGLHRTPQEIANRRSVNQQVMGGNIQARLRMFRIGASFSHTLMDAGLLKSSSPYLWFRFSGMQLTNAGADLTVILRKLSLFSEAAISSGGGRALLAGASATPDPRLAFSAIFRHYEKDYQSLFGNAFSENGTGSNETGLYLGLFAQLHRRWVLSAYGDHFRFPWLKYRTDTPSGGREYAARLTWTPSRKTEVYAGFTFREKNINPAGTGPYSAFPEKETKQSFRLHFSIEATPELTLKSRVETLIREKQNNVKTSGFLIYQDLIFKLPEKPWTISTRFSLFDTDTYDDRIYAYESDVLYSFSVPANYYMGNSFYLLGKYSVMKNLDLWIRYSRTEFTHKPSGISLADETGSDGKSEIKIQLRLKL